MPDYSTNDVVLVRYPFSFALCFLALKSRFQSLFFSTGSGNSASATIESFQSLFFWIHL